MHLFTYVPPFGKSEGMGTGFLAKGVVYEGEWKDGKMHGIGTKTSVDGTVQHGIWENDKFVKTIERK